MNFAFVFCCPFMISAIATDFFDKEIHPQSKGSNSNENESAFYTDNRTQRTKP